MTPTKNMSAQIITNQNNNENLDQKKNLMPATQNGDGSDKQVVKLPSINSVAALAQF